MYKFPNFNFNPGKYFPFLIGIFFFLDITSSNSIGSPNFQPPLVAPLDLSVDPCEDFYAFACNKWAQFNPNQYHGESWDPHATIIIKNYEIMKNLLEKPLNSFRSNAERKAKIYYESCIDSSNIREHLGPLPMLKLIQYLEGWSETDKMYQESRYNLQTTLEMMENYYHVQALFGFKVMQDPRNAFQTVLMLHPPKFTLPTDMSTDVNLVKHLDIMTKSFILLGGDKMSTRDHMRNVIDFERKLMKFVEWKPKNNSIRGLQDLSGFINWHAFFQHGFSQIDKRISKTHEIITYNPEYFSHLSELIAKYQKSKEGRIVLNNYLIWRVIHKYQNGLDQTFRYLHGVHANLQKSLRKTGMEYANSGNWMSCVAEITEQELETSPLGLIVAGMFARETFAQDTKQEVQRMTANIRNAFKNNLWNQIWMDVHARQATAIKVESLTELIGYPDFVLDPQDLDRRYQNLQIEQNNYFQNIINIQRFSFLENLHKLDQPEDKTIWTSSPVMANAFYNAGRNQISIPIGILQNPLYNKQNRIVQNYAGIGTMLGHEITHAFDQQGAEFDKDGNFRPWWSPETIKKFSTLTDCFVRQYQKYEMYGLYINGTRTLGDNISDNGGMKAAYNAYVQNFNEKSVLIQGKEFTDRQQFFISFAQSWCSASSVNRTIWLMLNDEHSPNKYRVIGTLQNSEEFGAVFKCKKNSYMNPVEKCTLW